jgi:hypothetical protein
MNYTRNDLSWTAQDNTDMRQLTRRLRILKRKLFLAAVANQQVAPAGDVASSTTSSGAHRRVTLAVVEAPALKTMHPYHRPVPPSTPTLVVGDNTKTMGGGVPPARGGLHPTSYKTAASASRTIVSTVPRRA